MRTSEEKTRRHATMKIALLIGLVAVAVVADFVTREVLKTREEQAEKVTAELMPADAQNHHKLEDDAQKVIAAGVVDCGTYGESYSPEEWGSRDPLMAKEGNKAAVDACSVNALKKRKPFKAHYYFVGTKSEKHGTVVGNAKGWVYFLRDVHSYGELSPRFASELDKKPAIIVESRRARLAKATWNK